jgi:protein TonB
MISLDEAPRRHAPEQDAVLPERGPSVEFHVDEPVKIFSAVKSMDQELPQDTGLQAPTVELRGRLSSPAASVGPDESKPNGSQMQSHISGGHELLGDVAEGPTKPGINFTGDALRNFARVVRKKIESSKKYPVAAHSVGIEGRTGVKIIILRDGRLKKVEVVKSSGRRILDRAAVQSVHDAAPFPPIPEKLRKDEIEMSITLVFKIT